MALSTGPNLGLLINGSPAEEHYDALMNQWRGLDVLVQPNVIGILSTPPGGPANGAAYIIGPSATGAWAGLENRVARFSSVLNSWEVFNPKAGWEFFNQTTGAKMRFSGGAWTYVRQLQSHIVKITDDSTLLHSTPAFTSAVSTKIVLPYSFFLMRVGISVNIAQASGSDIRVTMTANGVNVLDAAYMQIPNGSKYVFVNAADLAVSNIDEFAEVVITLTQVNSPTAATGLKAYLVGYAPTLLT